MKEISNKIQNGPKIKKKSKIHYLITTYTLLFFVLMLIMYDTTALYNEKSYDFFKKL